MVSLVWFRNDLRIKDNPALLDASDHGTVHACFIVSGEQWRQHKVGDRRIAFIGRAVNSLAKELASLGITLQLIDAANFSQVPIALLTHANNLGARRVVFNAEYPTNEVERDQAVTDVLQANDIAVVRSHGGVTHPPGSVLTNKGAPYSVFTPFKKTWLKQLQPDAIRPLAPPPPQDSSVHPVQVDHLAGVPVALGATDWPASEADASRLLKTFTEGPIDHYAHTRNIPALSSTSKLSAHLSIGTLSSNQCLHAALQKSPDELADHHTRAWFEQIIWRDFYRHVVALFPHVSRGQAFRRQYNQIPWRQDPASLEAWKNGRTGYPLVDAGMRQLRATGWMHNRLRMVTAMFLTKHLLIDWREGEAYFMEQLVDGDFAANNGGWQWSASTGTDATPYFRLFNPTTQGSRFDPQGLFTKQWIPELADVPAKHLFEPHKTPLNLAYPRPIVDHKRARDRVITVFKSIRSNA